MSSRFEASLSSMSDLFFFFWGGRGGLPVLCLFVSCLVAYVIPNEGLNLGLSSESIVLTTDHKEVPMSYPLV